MKKKSFKLGTTKKFSGAKNLITQGSILVASTFIVRLMNVFYRVPVTNLWGDSGLGTYGDAYQVYSFFLVFASVSIPTTLSKLLSDRFALGKKQEVKRIMRVALLLVGGIGLLCMLIMVFGGAFIARAMYDNPDAARPIRFLGPTVFIVALMSVLRGYFQGLNNMKPTAISEVIEGFLHAVFAVVLAFLLYRGGDLSWSVTGGIFGTLIGAIGGILFLALCYAVYQNVQTRDEQESEEKEEEVKSYREILVEMLKLMIPIVLSSTAFSIKGIIDASMFGKLMIAEGYSSELAVAMRGIYTGKFVVLINLPIAIGDALGAAAVPAVSASYALHNTDELHEEFRSIIKSTLIIAVPCAIGMMTLGKPALRMLFSGSYLGGELFWTGGLSVVFYCLNYGASGVLQGLNKAQYPMYHVLIGVAVSCLLNVLTIRVFHLGIHSLAINSAVFSFLIMFLNYRSAMRFCDVRVDLWKLAKGPLGCSLLMAVICVGAYLCSFAAFGSNMIATIISIVVGILSYFTLMVNLGGMSVRDMDNLPGGKYLGKLKF